MLRLLLSITKRQKTWLESRSKLLGTSQTELIRRLIDAEMERLQK